MGMKMKRMKGIELSCTSPASTAICSSTELRSMVRNGPKPLPHQRLRDHYIANNFHYNFIDNNNNSSRLTLAPCISELPFTPRPSSSSSQQLRRKSSADVSDLRRHKFIYMDSPPSGHSSRYLLGGSDSAKQCSALVPSTPVVVHARANKNMVNSSNTHRQAERNSSYGTDHAQTTVGHHRYCTNSTLVKSSSSASSPDQVQVVVLRVSLHCKACAGKLRKYLSKMEGVKSFDIDLETKKVTVIGNVTPLGVLSSISKVKNAQLWPSPTSTSSTSSSSLSSSSTFD